MNTSPITTWEGATAYFTFANDPAVHIELLILAAIALVGSIVYGSLHEKGCYVKIENGKY